MQILSPIIISDQVNRGEKKLIHTESLIWQYAHSVLPESALEKLISVCMELAQPAAAVGKPHANSLTKANIFTTLWNVSWTKAKPFRLYVAQFPHLPIRIAITRMVAIVCVVLPNATASSSETTARSYCIHSSDSGRVYIHGKYNSLEVFDDGTMAALFGKDFLKQMSKKNCTKEWSATTQALGTTQLLMSKLANGNPSGPAFGVESLMGISQTGDDSRLNALQAPRLEALIMVAVTNKECTITTDNPKLETLVKLRKSMADFVEHMTEVSKQVNEEIELQGLISILANEDYMKIRTAPSQATPSPMTT